MAQRPKQERKKKKKSQDGSVQPKDAGILQVPTCILSLDHYKAQTGLVRLVSCILEWLRAADWSHSENPWAVEFRADTLNRSFAMKFVSRDWVWKGTVGPDPVSLTSGLMPLNIPLWLHKRSYSCTGSTTFSP